MKTINNLFLTAIFALCSTFAFAQIDGTKHDFETATWNNGGFGDEICIVCHTPHNALTESAAPLWNHMVTTSSFTVYDTSTLDATVGQPTGVSKLCLSCHDGTVALDNYGGVSTGTSFITGSANFGSDLSNEHPISFTYDLALSSTDGELFNPATQTSGLGDTIAADMLFGGSLECASCHDVHGTAVTYLLHKTNAASGLCLTCHNK